MVKACRCTSKTAVDRHQPPTLSGVEVVAPVDQSSIASARRDAASTLIRRTSACALATAATKTGSWGQGDTTALEQFPGGIFITPTSAKGRMSKGNQRYIAISGRGTDQPRALRVSTTIPSLAIVGCNYRGQSGKRCNAWIACCRAGSD